MKQYRWTCNLCNKSGQMNLESEASALVGYTELLRSHGRDSPSCAARTADLKTEEINPK
jgi:hypothetical protein